MHPLSLDLSEASYRELVENANDIIYVHDLEGRFTWVNKACERIIGFPPQELLQRTIWQVLAPGYVERTRDAMKHRLTAELQPFAIEVLARDGRRVPLEVSTRLLFRDGKAYAVQGIARDITERRAAEEALRASEDKFRALVEQSLVGCYIIQGTRIVYCNPKYAEIFGYGSPDEMVGMTLAEVTAPEDLARARDYVARRMEGSLQSAHYAFHALRKDGSRIDVEVHGARTVFNGAPAIIGTLLDITERRRVERAMRESEERYALAALGVNDGLWDWDLRQNRIHVSDRFRSQLGLGPEDGAFDHPESWFDRVHPDDRDRLLAELALHIEGRAQHLETEVRVRHTDGSERWMLVRGAAVRDAAGKAVRVAGSQTDITQRKQAEKKLEHDALHDTLTGLPNRTLFHDRLGQAMAFQRRATHPFAVLVLDVDRFKTVNDSLGHVRGDQLLVQVARRLSSCVRPGDTVARLGGDEFALLLEDYGVPDEPLHVAERVHAALSAPFDLQGTEVFTSASIGVALGEPGYARPEEVLRDADTAMYRAKDRGRGRHAVFHPAMHARARAQLQLETDLRRALERNELRLTYQPVVTLATRKVAGCEALIGWQHPTRGHIGPDEFIPVAEETGLIVPIGRWALATACADALTFRSDITVAVNLSAGQLAHKELLDDVRAALQRSGVAAARLRLEVTESVIMEHAGPASTVLGELHAMGVHLLLDDFGTGYSSLAYLHNFRFDTLKVDRSFVSRLGMPGRDAEIVRTIVSLARALGMEVVAEGVENEAQLAELQKLAVEYGQGWLFSRPLDARAFREASSAPSIPPPPPA